VGRISGGWNSLQVPRLGGAHSSTTQILQPIIIQADKMANKLFNLFKLLASAKSGAAAVAPSEIYTGWNPWNA